MKRKYKLLSVTALLTVLVFSISLAVPTLAEENGETIYIKTVDDLLELAENCSLDTWSQDKTIILDADISLADTDFWPIPTFGGIFEGNGHTISDLSISESVTPAGLFGVLQETAVVKNLSVAGALTPDGDADTLGGIVGENNGLIENCNFTGSISGGNNIGGIAGINTVTGIIRSCDSSGVVFGDNMTGGITGYNLGMIDSCENHAYVNIASIDSSLKPEDINLGFMLDLSRISSLDTGAAASDTGGIVGYSSGVVQNCSNYSTIGYQHVGYNVGGIAGRSCGYIVACENKAEIYGRKDVGGIVGQVEPYINANLSENTLSKLKSQLDELNRMVNAALDDVNAGVGTVTSRLNKIVDYTDNAADAVSNISTYGSISSTVAGSGQTSGGGSVTVTPPQFEISGEGEKGADANIEISPGAASSEGGVYVGGNLQSGLTESSVEGDRNSSANGQVNASTQIQLNTSLHGLSSAVNGMTGQMRLLNGEVCGISNTLTDDLKAISNQINDIGNTLFDAALNTEQSDIVEDTSLINIDEVTIGKVFYSQNSGTVYGDINIGGITGAMGIEYELDPEDDITGNLSGTQRRTYELKAIIQNCTNTGTVTAKRSYAGGIVGRMDLGLVTAAESYGAVESENGDYVGGIAGITGGTIHNSFVKCTLQGGSYIGGIVGSGIDESASGSSSTVTGCYSLVDIPVYEQFVGAISGVNTGQFLENYFVSDKLAGINRMSYSGQAEPITYAVLINQGTDTETEGADAVNIPAPFQTLTLRFVADGETIKEIPFDYDASFDESIYPELPEKEGYYAYWDISELSDLHYDTVVTAVYEAYVTALTSDADRSNDRPIFIVEGKFDEEATLTASPQANTPTEFDIFPKDLLDGLKKCFSSNSISLEIVEQWNIEIPEDGQDVHTLRYLAPDGNTENIDIYVKKDAAWSKVDTEVVGRYLVFPVSGTPARIAAVSTMSVWWVWLIAAILLLLLLLLLFRILWKIKKALVATVSKRSVSEEEDIPEESAPAPTPQKEAPNKKRRWLMPLLVLLSLILGIIGTAAYFMLPDLMKDYKAYELLKSYVEQQELTMELAVTAQLGTQKMDFQAQIDRAEAEGQRITAISQEGRSLYYTGGIVLLENGKAYKLADTYPDYTQLLSQAMELYQYADISAENGVYKMTAEQENARAILKTLLPGMGDFTETNSVAVEMVCNGDTLEELHFSANGKMDNSKQSSFTVSAVLRICSDEKEKLKIPQAVKDVVIKGEYETAADLSENLIGLVSAWEELNSRNPLAAELSLEANCGPLVLNDTLALYRWNTEEGVISSIQKNGYELYFTDEKICDKEGKIVVNASDTSVDAAGLIQIAYQLCMNMDLECSGNGSVKTYTLSLDEEGMKSVAYAIAPKTEDMDIRFTSGTIELTIQNEKLQKISFACGGSMKIVLSDTEVSLGAELKFSQAQTDAEVPAKVMEVLQ